jgi:hypothetical protein
MDDDVIALRREAIDPDVEVAKEPLTRLTRVVADGRALGLWQLTGRVERAGEVRKIGS